VRERRPIDPESLLEHARGVRELAVALCRDGNDADDVVQETWRLALERGAPPHASVGAWLAGIVRRLAHSVSRSEARRRDRERLVARDERLASPDELAARAALHRELVEAVLALDEPSRSALLLRYFEGLKPAEIAVREHLEVDAVKSRLSRGLAQLRRRMGLDREQRSHAWIAALGLTRRVTVQPLALGALMKLSSSLPLAIAALSVVAAVCLWVAQPDVHEDASDAEVAAAIAALPELDELERETGSRDPAVAQDLAPAPEPIPSEPAGVKPAVTGRVVDLDGRPIPGATVSTVFDREQTGSSKAMNETHLARAVIGTTVASPDGSFRIDTPPDVRVDLEANAPSRRASVVVGVEPGDDVVVVLGGGCTLSGRITRADNGAGVADARVLGIYSSQGDARIPEFRTISDETGRYEIRDLAPGRLRLVVEARELIGEGFVIVELARGEHAVADVALEPGAELEVQVLDARDGAPIKGAIVHSRSEELAETTSETGKVVLRGLRPATQCRVLARAEGYGTCGRGVLLQDAWGPLRIELRRERVAAGRVFDPDGRPLKGAAIRAYGGDDRIRTESAADGSFTLRGLSPEVRHVLWIGYPGFAEHVLDFPALELERDSFGQGEITLARPSALDGRIVDAQGRALSGAGITLQGCNSDRSSGSPEPVYGYESYVASRRLVSRSDGTFRFVDLAEGQYTLAAQYGTARVDRQVPIGSDSEVEIELALDPGATMEGRVVGNTGDPMRDVWVTLYPEPFEGRQVASLETDHLGRFTVHGLQPHATYTIDVDDVLGRDPRRAPLAWRRFSGIGIAEREIVLTMPDAVWVEGVVVDAGERPLAACSVQVDVRWGPSTTSNRDGRFRLAVEPGVVIDLKAFQSESGARSIGKLTGVVPPATGLVIRMRRP
jgi:RNA polymerase sigma factor (sigma-70 family)